MSDPTQLPADSRAILLRYHEVALKGGNRGWFEERLASNARRLVTRAQGISREVTSERRSGRILLYADWNESARSGLSRVFGLSGYGPIRIVETSIEVILRAALEEVAALPRLPASFRVSSRRSDKVVPETSLELDKLVGSAVQAAYPSLRVSLLEPEVTVGIEIRRGHSFVWVEKVDGAGGLPVGTNGPVLTLLSGGLDSPVAAIRILKRGSTSHFIHFDGAPFTGPESVTKVERLVTVINRYQPDPRPLHVVPFGPIQEKIALVTHPKLRTVLYRRMMMRIACALARRLKSEALVTGEALGQVASQTLANLSTINAVSVLPVLRPLVGFDKQEIVAEAKLRGTHDLSILPAADCCTLFADRHPTIHSSIHAATAEEACFSVEGLVAEAVEGIRVLRPG